MFDQEKFKATVFYIINKAGIDKTDMQKINVILWLSDIVSCDNTGISISGETYIKKTNGPEAMHLSSVLEELKTCDKEQRRDISIIREYTAYIDEAIEQYRNIDIQNIFSFVSISLWEATSYNEEIPAELASIEKLVNNDIDVDWDRID